MTIITYPFTTPGNYTFDPVKIEVVGGKAQLKHVVASGQIFNQDFSNSAGFTFDTNKAEFVGGAVQQKDVTPANSLFAVTYQTDANPITIEANLDWHKSGGLLTGVLNGTPIIVSGELVCTGAQGVYYTRNNAPVESHKFQYKPNYTTSPPTNINVHTGWNGSNLNDRYMLTHSPSGNTLRITLENSVGGSVIAVATAIGLPWTPTAGQKYEFEVVIDSVLGTVRVFVDGTLHGTLTPGAWTRGTSAIRYYLGASSTIYNQAEGSFDDYIAFDNAQHTTSYTPGYTVDLTIYNATNVNLPSFVHPNLGTIVTLDDFVTVEAGSPRYTIGLDSGTKQWWNGSAWVDSNGTYAQANDAATIDTNFPTLTAGTETTVEVCIHFTDTSTIGLVDDLTITHTANTIFNLTDPTIIPITTFSQDALLLFLSTFTAAGLDEIRFILQVDGQDKYWDGVAWSNSDGTFAQSNDLVTVQANLSSWNIRGITVPVIFLHSDDGSTTPDIDDLSIEFDFFGGPSTPENVVTVWGFLVDSEDDPMVGVDIEIKPTKYGVIDEKILGLLPKIVTTDSTGYWEIKLIETDSIVDTEFGYIFRFKDVRYIDFTSKKYVPDVVDINFNTLVDVV